MKPQGRLAKLGGRKHRRRQIPHRPVRDSRRERTSHRRWRKRSRNRSPLRHRSHNN
jgi:hypothetical protein